MQKPADTHLYKCFAFSFSFDMTERHTIWGVVIGGYFYWMTMYSCNQTMVQRYLAIPSKKKAQM